MEIVIEIQKPDGLILIHIFYIILVTINTQIHFKLVVIKMT